LTFFVGSVFSPSFVAANAAARRAGRAGAPPEDHPAVHLSLRSRSARAWVMTDHRADRLARARDRIAIGGSHLVRTASGYEAQIDERTAPFSSRIRGTVRLHLESTPPSAERQLDPRLRHRWAPLAPVARAEVELEHPALRFVGSGYLDHNSGAEPLEAGFDRWSWCRASARDLGTAVLFDLEGDRRFGLWCRPQGGVEPLELGPRRALGRSGWGLGRSAPAVLGAPTIEPTHLVAPIDDTPFYARSLLRVEMKGWQVLGIHETLALDRFRRRWVQLLLPFRIRSER
jgi:carotenoid 1,2-hydratase